MRRATALRSLAIASILAATVAHWQVWYAPRERVGSSAPGGLPGRLFDDSTYPLRLWMPYPHQNLGAVAEEVGDLERWLATAARLSGSRPPRLPALGPFLLPPGGELAVAADPASGRLAVALSTYPTVALVARLAGALAGNPWLSGGEVRLGDRGDAHVAWVGRTWTLTAGSSPAEGGGGENEPRPSLARFATRDGVSWLPPGEYYVERVEEGLWMAPSAPPVGLRARIGKLARPGLAVAATEEPSGGGIRALALWTSGEETVEGGRLPPLASLARTPAERWRLPGETLLDLAGRKLPTRSLGGWSATALETEVATRALDLAPILATTSEGLLPAAGGRLVWVSPGRLASAAGEVAALLEHLPLVGKTEASRWRDAEALLAPFAGCLEMAAVLPAPATVRFAGEAGSSVRETSAAVLLCGTAAAR